MNIIIIIIIIVTVRTFHVQKHFVRERLEVSLSIDGVNFAQRHLAEVLRTSKSGQSLVSKSRRLRHCNKCKKKNLDIFTTHVTALSDLISTTGGILKLDEVLPNSLMPEELSVKSTLQHTVTFIFLCSLVNYQFTLYLCVNDKRLKCHRCNRHLQLIFNIWSWLQLMQHSPTPRVSHR